MSLHVLLYLIFIISFIISFICSFYYITKNTNDKEQTNFVNTVVISEEVVINENQEPIIVSSNLL
jgi:hypothetical protein